VVLGEGLKVLVGGGGNLGEAIMNFVGDPPALLLLVQLQSRLWVMSHRASHGLTERISEASEVVVSAHKVLLSIAHKVS